MAARGPKSDKLWADAVRRAVLRRVSGADGNVKYLDQLANNLVAMALDNNTEAIKEIGNRLDGRPAQAIEHTGADGGAIVSKVTVQFIGADPEG